MMSFIYARAQKVIAWLGIREFSIKVNIVTVTNIRVSTTSTQWPSNSDLIEILAQESRDGVAGDLASTVVDSKRVKSSKEPGRNSFDFARIATSGYWTRLWIVQEVCLARELVFVLGGKVWRAEEVEGWEMLKRARDLKEQAGREVTGNEGLEARAMLRIVEARAGRYGDGMRLERLVERFMGQGCGNLKDKVYGLLGLAVDVRAAAEGEEDSFERNKFGSLDDTERWLEPELARGTGTLRVDYSRGFYDIWIDAVKAVYFLARPITERFPHLDGVYERAISVVRTAGALQAALGDMVEGELRHSGNAHIEEQPIIQALGYVAGEVTDIGPDYPSLVGSFRAQQQWLSTCERCYHDSDDLERLRIINERYSAKMIGYNDKDLSRICKIRSRTVLAWQGYRSIFNPGCADFDQKYHELWKRADHCEDTTGSLSRTPRICIGTEHLIALVPPATEVGDVIVRFWGSDAAFVMRQVTVDGSSRKEVPYFMLVGRADVADTSLQGDHSDDAGRFNLNTTKENKSLIWLNLGTRTLQLLTANITISDVES
ncbi:hypothetical protein QBC34DRAFT_410140 [Podospora aff. communis PSN243]|uniref:Heterokaryon incompatibility domain-containing protein n=1 Tax=Podospora aff. communis PSN243 TaxID=3040156 RepID=A0AAV9GEJ6_9PEZI|nr:hypothetical protein QBC34DRAFT_410140 [Podospora aff. communis PSN243]